MGKGGTHLQTRIREMRLQVDLATAGRRSERRSGEEGQHGPRQVHRPAARNEDVGAEVELVALSCLLQVEEDRVREEFLNHEVPEVRGHDGRAALLVAVVAESHPLCPLRQVFPSVV